MYPKAQGKKKRKTNNELNKYKRPAIWRLPLATLRLRPSPAVGRSRNATAATATASAEKKLPAAGLGFRARASRISSLASGRGGPRYCGGQPSGFKKWLSAPTTTEHQMAQQQPLTAECLDKFANPRLLEPEPATGLWLVACCLAAGRCSG
jgi:hypothetical protein